MKDTIQIAAIAAADALVAWVEAGDAYALLLRPAAERNHEEPELAYCRCVRAHGAMMRAARRYAKLRDLASCATDGTPAA